VLKKTPYLFKIEIMLTTDLQDISEAKKAALEVLLHNAIGPFQGLPRTAGWGYPEPYTRDLMFSIFGVAVSDNPKLINSIRKVLEVLAKNQTEKGHITSLVHDKDDRGSSDSTPLFLLGVGIFRKVSGEPDFLQEAVEKALTWMAYQSPSDRYLVAQQPTSDWRDEQWVLGYGLFVNTLVYSYLRILGQPERAGKVRHEMSRFTVTGGIMHHHVHEGLVVKHKPYYAFWSYKVHSSERFDLLGNSLAILSGIASPSRAHDMISWIEAECDNMKKKGELSIDLPPNFFPFTHPEDPDWHARYARFNNPGEYHNGGIWPFICGFYVAALVAAKRYKLAEEKLVVLTHLIKKVNNETDVPSEKLPNETAATFGFNEWVKAQDGEPKGQNWQTWSAALYLYAVKCVETKKTPFFDDIRQE
jgi:Alkaline and neutral invertase